MRTMDWKRGVGVACLLTALVAAPARAQTRGPIQEPAGIPVVNSGAKALGSPFSPEYQAAWYQSQANRIAMMAWMEHDMAMRQAYLEELAARKQAIAANDAAKKAEENKHGKVVWTKVGTPLGYKKSDGKIVSSRPIESTAVASSTPIAKDAPMAVVVKDATPMPAPKVMSETVYEVKPDGTMVEMKPAPTATVNVIESAPQTIASQPTIVAPKR